MYVESEKNRLFLPVWIFGWFPCEIQCWCWGVPFGTFFLLPLTSTLSSYFIHFLLVTYFSNSFFQRAVTTATGSTGTEPLRSLKTFSTSFPLTDRRSPDFGFYRESQYRYIASDRPTSFSGINQSSGPLFLSLKTGGVYSGGLLRLLRGWICLS